MTISSPVKNVTCKRYSLTELLSGVTPKNLKTLHKKTDWARAGNPQVVNWHNQRL